MEQAGVLSFVAKGNTSPSSGGIRTFPQNTYGVSKESPDHFRQKHTIVNPHGYLYRHDQAPEF